MQLRAIGRELSAGAIVGLSALIYSLSYGALLFSGSLAPYVGVGIAIALVTAIVGALFAWIAEDGSFIHGPDPNTITVLASVLAASGSLGATGAESAERAAGFVFATALVCAVAFWMFGRARLSSLVRFLPFSVMAGFLAATGWLMVSGALNIISGTPLTRLGIERLVADPVRPELAVALVVVGALFGLNRRLAGAVVIPAVMLVTAFAVNAFLASGLCESAACAPDRWLFPTLAGLQWTPWWRLGLGLSDLGLLVDHLPAMLVVSFVALLTILLSIASLELSHEREFELDRVLRLHAGIAGTAALLGGFVPVIGINRTEMNRRMGGTALAATTGALICLIALFGGGGLFRLFPKAALGALLLFLGLGTLKQWLWDQRGRARPVEVAQTLLILALVARYGFMVGFSAGLVIACVVFVVTYSRIPMTQLTTDVADFRSSVVRPDAEAAVLQEVGPHVRVYRLGGYIFFGSAAMIEAVFATMDGRVRGVILDFTNVTGIDSSAVSVFQRILRRYQGRSTRFYLVCPPVHAAVVRALTPAAGGAVTRFFPTLDHAVESAEEDLIAEAHPNGEGPGPAPALAFLERGEDRAELLAHCDLRRLVAGERLCAEGDRSDEIFFVETGQLEVIKDAVPPVRLAKLNRGAMVGELAFYTEEPRTASIVAAVDSMVYVLGRSALETLRATRPELATRFDHMVIRRVSKALSRANRLMTVLR